MPPHSIGEWVVGRNITPGTFARPSRREVVKVAVTTDDENESNTLSVTYPRTRKTGAKKVRFHMTSPRRSALKHWAGNSSSETLIGEDSSSSGVEDYSIVGSDTVDYDTEGSYQGDATDSSTRITRTKRTTKVKRHRRILTSELGSSTDDETDDDPHPTCPCPKCISGRRKLKIAKKRQKEADTSDDATEDSEDLKSKSKSKSKQQQKGGKKSKTSKDEATSTEASDADEKTDAETSDEPTTRQSKKQNSKNEKQAASNGKEKNNDSNSKGKEVSKKASNTKSVDNKSQENSNTQDTSAKTKVSKKSTKLPEPSPPSDLRAPHLIMPITAKVLQVEHAVETPEDPRPNAFVDQQHGVVRVYHGPAYGNPYGSLYPHRTWSGQVPPAGVPHPLNNPYFNGFKAPAEQNLGNIPPVGNFSQPSGAFPWPSGSYPQTSFPNPPGMTSYGTNGFPPPAPQVAGMTDEEAAAAVAQGIGLTGLPPHPVSIPAANSYPWERDGKANPDPWSAAKDKTSEAANNVGPDFMSIDPSKMFCAPRLQGDSANGGSQRSNQSKKSKNGGKSKAGEKDASRFTNDGGYRSWGKHNNNDNQNDNDGWGTVENNTFGKTDKASGGGWGGSGSQRGSGMLDSLPLFFNMPDQGVASGGDAWGGNKGDSGTKTSPEPPTDQPADTSQGGGNTWGSGNNNGFQNNSGGFSNNFGGDNQNFGGGSNHGSNNGDWNQGNSGRNGFNSPVGQGSRQGSQSGKNKWTDGTSSMPGAWSGSQNGGGSRRTSGNWNNTSDNVGAWNSGASNHHNSPNLNSSWNNSGHDGSGSHHGDNSGNGAWGGGGSPKNNGGWSGGGWGNDNAQNNDDRLPAWADPTVAQSTQGPGVSNW
ncbi:hypothetical protein UCRPA7_1730 [Phaeoacremonium minimum UCRPA7]|uniref:Uncharacterized protein n=1 Tax=Phaeoacremonium minimum (strain UCR-PA7) TaxID=1286976 RepID=R8BTR8_PHAM7|nr:hypothetical protein UCRPA7_1730 [Phaeoacremonium minimum UCRPA7]EOO02762.1 hypothetical protein UCRPA7_1730 [Phaeoacremonium minimum UCRPA7]